MSDPSGVVSLVEYRATLSVALDLALLEVRVNAALKLAAQWIHEHGRIPTVMDVAECADRNTRVGLAAVLRHGITIEIN